MAFPGIVCLVSTLFAVLVAPVWAEEPYQVNWLVQYGTPAYEDARGIAADGKAEISFSVVPSNGITPPPDLIQGPSVATIAAEIIAVRSGLGCR
jgi:hypothetical protein